MRIEDMLARADACEEMADRVGDPNTAWSLLEAAQQWRNMASQMVLLEREPTYRMLRARTE